MHPLSQNILHQPVSALTPSVRESIIWPLIEQVKNELRCCGLKKLCQNIDFYFGDEWFSPEGLCSVSIPFYLSRPLLKQMVRKHGNKTIEGGDKKWFLKLLRHEIGHTFDHAYNISNLVEFRSIFGNPKQHYRVEHYTSNDSDPNYVEHLPDNYAQSHPQEDFAETLAIWLDPGSDWQSIYLNQPVVLRKLNFIQTLVQKYQSKVPYQYSLVKERSYNAHSITANLISFCQNMP